MIHGCGANSTAVNLQQALVVDTTAERCPQPTARDRHEAKRWVALPAPDVEMDGARTYSVQALQEWIDNHEAGQFRKNRALARVISEYDKCRGVKRVDDDIS